MGPLERAGFFFSGGSGPAQLTETYMDFLKHIPIHAAFLPK